MTRAGQSVERELIRDNSAMIRHSAKDVIFELLLGAILTVVVLTLFPNDWKGSRLIDLRSGAVMAEGAIEGQ